MDFDLEELVNLEQTFYDDGFTDGFAHGRIHGSIEGRALGREKGFEMWEEIGFYEGFARMWQAIYIARGSDDRTMHHIDQLLELTALFPRINPSATEPSDLDIPKLFRQIRSRYKALCASLGVKATLRAGGQITSAEETEYGNASSGIKPTGSRNVWPVQAASHQPAGDQFSF